jgi:hypothetical protein
VIEKLRINEHDEIRIASFFSSINQTKLYIFNLETNLFFFSQLLYTTSLHIPIKSTLIRRLSVVYFRPDLDYTLFIYFVLFIKREAKIYSETGKKRENYFFNLSIIIIINNIFLNYFNKKRILF